MIIFRYLCKEVFAVLLAATLILLIIFITNQFVHYLNDAAGGKETIKAVMELMLLQVPIFLGYLLPLSLFLGVLLALGRLCVDHEMVVLSACGVSRAQLVMMVLLLSTFVMGVVAWLMLSLEPKVQWSNSKILANAAASASLEKVLPGRFQSYGNDMVFYAAGMTDHHRTMTDVLFAKKGTQKDGSESWDVVNASQAGEINKKNDGRFLLFKKGFRYIGVPGEAQYHVVKFGTYGIRLTKPSADIAGRVEVMSTQKLWHLHKTNLKAAAELQWRIAMPLSVLILALLAVPLSDVNPRKGKFAQMLPAILIYIAYLNLLLLGKGWIAKGLMSQTVGLWWIHGSLLLLALVLLLAQKNWRRWLAFSRRK